MVWKVYKRVNNRFLIGGEMVVWGSGYIGVK